MVETPYTAYSRMSRNESAFQTQSSTSARSLQKNQSAITLLIEEQKN